MVVRLEKGDIMNINKICNTISGLKGYEQHVRLLYRVLRRYGPVDDIWFDRVFSSFKLHNGRYVIKKAGCYLLPLERDSFVPPMNGDRTQQLYLLILKTLCRHGYVQRRFKGERAIYSL